MEKLSFYGVVVNENNFTLWGTKEYVECMLKHYDTYFNDILTYRGYVFLRDIYETLGIPVNRRCLYAGLVNMEKHRSGRISFTCKYDAKRNEFHLDFNPEANIVKYF